MSPHSVYMGKIKLNITGVDSLTASQLQMDSQETLNKSVLPASAASAFDVIICELCLAQGPPADKPAPPSGRLGLKIKWRALCVSWGTPCTGPSPPAVARAEVL